MVVVGNEGQKIVTHDGVWYGTVSPPWKGVVSSLTMVVSVETVRSRTVSHPLRIFFEG